MLCELQLWNYWHVSGGGVQKFKLALKQRGVSYPLATYQLGASFWVAAVALKALKTTSLGGWVVHNYTDNKAISAPSWQKVNMDLTFFK